jgi:hypothetical protein
MLYHLSNKNVKYLLVLICHDHFLHKLKWLWQTELKYKLHY